MSGVGRLVAGLGLCGLLSSPSVQAGGYIFAGEANGVDVVAHPSGYTGSGGVITVRVCIVPGSPNASQIEAAIRNNIAVLNQMVPTLGNLKSGANNNIPAGSIDFESVSLHEMGHCLGLSHVNAATESGLSGSNRNYTKATDGVNNVYDIDPGVDGVIGSADDVRGDDVNLIYFNRANNDPFTLASPVDATTYSRDLADLPPGDLFAANADRAVSTLLGYPKSEAVMQQGSFFDESQRNLGHDDVAALRYAQSGVDSLAGATADNYTTVLEYGGISATNCDINVGFTNTGSFAFCSLNGTFIGTGHIRVTSATIEFGQAYNWFFNTLNNSPQLAAIADPVFVIAGASRQVGLSATDADAGDGLSFSAGGLPAFASLVDHGDGTASLDFSPLVADTGSYAIDLAVTDSGDPALQASQSISVIVDVDTDGDGLSDSEETLLYGTSTTLADTDGDGFDDGDEVISGSDPLDPQNWPAIADGDVAPLGLPDGVLNSADLLLIERIVAGELTASPLELGHGDVYPPGSPDGTIDLSDMLLIQKMVIGAP